MSDTPIQMIPKIAKWAKHGGKIKRGSMNRHEGPKRQRTDAKLLAENAIARGWLNGKPRARKVGTHAAV